MKKSKKKWDKKYADGRKFVLRGISVKESKSGKKVLLKLGREKNFLISKSLANKYLVPVE